MKTNNSNDSFQSVRVYCSKAKTRLFLLATLPCLIGSAWAQSLPIDPASVMMKIKNSLIVTPAPVIMPGTPIGQPGPTPLGPPTTPPVNGPK